MTIISSADESAYLSFAALLELLNHSDSEFLAVCHESESVTFNSTVLAPADAPEHVASLPDDANIWFSVNPTAGPARVRDKRGGAVDVTRLAALFADLDVKDGGCPNYEVAQQIIDELSIILGTGPVAVTYSGHGVQPLWLVRDGHVRDESDRDRIDLLLKRWGRIVQSVAKSLGAHADSVFNLDRILRVPETVNNKSEPVPVVCHANGGRGLSLNEIALALNSCGIEFSDSSGPGSYGIDSESSDAEIKAWAKATFNEPDSMCYVVKTATDKWVNAIRMEGQSNPNVFRGYWEILNLAADFHSGWNTALISIGETYYNEVVEVRTKRPDHKVRREIDHALVDGLRKVKAALDQTQRAGEPFTKGECPWCYPSPEDLDEWNRNMTSQMNPWFGKIKGPKPAFPSSVAEWVVNRAKKARRPIHFWQGQFWTWNGTHWTAGSGDELKAALITTLKDVYYPEDTTDPNSPPVWWNPKSSTIGDVVSMLKGVAFLDTEIEAQSWLNGREDQMIACRNGLVRISDRKKFDHSSQYLNTFSLPFDYDPKAKSRELVEFLKSTLPDDEEAQRALRMWFGYFISGMTDQQKMLMLVGLPRSGKGTIAAMIKALLGNGSHAPVTATELNGTFGLQPLVGKTLGIFADARVNVSGRLFIERLLSITGEDDQNVNIKGLPQLVAKLLIRFLFLSNEPPIINDSSGAIVNRMIGINLPGDFSEKPDLGLQKRLLNPTEMSGVLNWALDGLDDLLDRGDLGFIQPESGKGILTIAGEGASPIKSYINEKYILDKDGIVLKSDAFQGWLTWCEAHGYVPGKEGIARNDVHFARDLYAAFNKKIVSDRISVGGRQRQYFRGLRPIQARGAAAARVVGQQRFFEGLADES